MAASDERKPVTVLFADLAGSTELATRHDPEHLRALLSAFFDEMRQQIEAYGGTVEKYAGDAIMAVFGVPHVHEDDAERAVRAAVAMRDSLDQLNPMFEQEYGVRLALRVGLATGEAVAATSEAREFLVTGEVPNLAARLQSVADGIAVSEETHRLVAPLVEAEPTGPLALKGFPRPVTAHRVLRLRAGATRPRGIPGLSSPVVGRDAEMAALWSCLEDLRRGRGQVVSIVGEAGIGKSRVKGEIRDHLPQDVRWLEGRCQSYTQSTSYAPVIEILRSALGLGPAEAPAIARTKLRAGLRGLARERGDQVLGAVAQLLGVDLGPGGGAAPPDPRSLQSQLILAARDILEGLAQRGPVILAVEDLHWADAASAELLTGLLELTDLHQLMVLVTSRPETEGDGWTFHLHARRSYSHRLTDLRLGPLGAEDTQRLTDNLLRVSDLPGAVRQRILERAEGNPFFLEEIIRALIEQGGLSHDGERWIAVGDVDRWAIPATLRGVLAARIDRLPEPTKAVLQRAAVVGRFFEYRTLRAIGEEPGELDRALAHLLRSELIREWARLPERQYLFKHALTQEAAYASLTGEPRKALHAKVAGHLEETHGVGTAEHAAVLAHHWHAAEEWTRALRYTVAAAERARALYARPEAVGHYWLALEILERLPRDDERRRQHADVVTALLQLPWARDEGARRAGLEHLDRAIEACAEQGDTPRLVRLETLKGVIAGDDTLLAGAVARAEATGDALAIAFATRWRGQLLGRLGRWDEALSLFGRSAAILAERGDRHQYALEINSGGRCWSSRAGKLADALRYAAHFRQLAAELGDARLRAWQAMEAEPYIYLGAWEDAIRVAEENLPVAWEIGETGVIMFASAWLGLAYLKLGRLDDARRTVDRAIQHAGWSITGTAFSLAYATTAAALIQLAEGDLDAAVETARRAVVFAEQSRFRLEQGAAHRVLGQTLAATGKRAEAEAALRKSLEILEDIRSLPEIGQTLVAYGRFKADEDPSEGRRLLERARVIFEEIGATGWLAEAGAALEAP